MRRLSYGGVPILSSLVSVRFASHIIRKFILSRVYNQPVIPWNLLPPVFGSSVIADVESTTTRTLASGSHSRFTFSYYLKSFISKGSNLLADTEWGVYSGTTIAKGVMIMVYYGEILSTKETKKRQKEVYDPRNLNYILTVREHFNSNTILRTNIDATRLGSTLFLLLSYFKFVALVALVIIVLLFWTLWSFFNRF